MKTLNKKNLTGAAALLLAGSTLIFAAPDGAGKKEDKSPQKLAEQLREGRGNNSEMLQELMRRAIENGGSLELDAKDFEKLMKQNGVEGKPLTPEEFGQMLGGDWMERLGKNSEKVDDDDKGPEAEPEKKDAMKSFLEMFQQRLSGRRVGENEREHDSILDEYKPVVADARLSTVSLVVGRKQVALGTVVDSDGYVVTKASEVAGKDLRCVLPGGVGVSAKVVDVYEPLDLALVRVGADGLESVDWADDDSVELGTFLAAPGIGDNPVAIGVASVAPRSLSERTKGFLGVFPEEVEGKVVLRSVGEKTPAAIAGLKAGDVVLEIDGEQVDNSAKFRRLIAGYRPGDEVKFKISRDGEDEDKELRAKLISREAGIQISGGGQAPRNARIDRMNQMGGKLSGNREGFASVLQTDLTLEPTECGGPVVNLDGKVIGVNIARGGRVKSYAIPAKELRSLLSDVDSGKFSVTDLTELKRASSLAEAAVAKAEAALKAAREAKEAADEALEKAQNK